MKSSIVKKGREVDDNDVLNRNVKVFFQRQAVEYMVILEQFVGLGGRVAEFEMTQISWCVSELNCVCLTVSLKSVDWESYMRV